ncbi:feline leukemia virus subgroup C receptor-related protein 2 [Diachasma alloeum]|uniref:feline leukemia virus subgroup C receptor-related protein 2 n=1 Tax=Diachasma alloeum TaxID=454923 RepID=UPI0007383261|nr:feline leukemia virus subgroup C receptor-related protein 2 [Diachasma alloeum]
MTNMGIEKSPEEKNISKMEIKDSKWRWVLMAVYIFYCGISAFQWVEYSIVANIIVRYYNVTVEKVDYTAMAYMLFPIPLVIPGSHLAECIGLRWTNIVGSGLICLGSCIKVFSVHSDRFLVTLIGQSFLATSQVVILTIPGRLGALWFPLRQISTATSLAVFGAQLGIASGFFLTPLCIRNHENVENIGEDLSRLFWVMAALSTVAFLLVLILFKDEPKYPPSETRALQKQKREEAEMTLKEPIKRLMKNQSYLILCNSYGLGIGVLNALSTMLNQIVLAHFEDGQEFAGRLGLGIIVMGMFGSVAFGVILDKTQKFKATTVTVYFLTLCGQVFFALSMWLESIPLAYVAACFLGFFISGYLALGYEMCAEYTYPESESLATGILNIGNNLYGIILVLICSRLKEYHGDIAVHICLCSSLLVGFIMTVFTKDEQRRQDARRNNLYTGVAH